MIQCFAWGLDSFLGEIVFVAKNIVPDWIQVLNFHLSLLKFRIVKPL